MSDIPADIIQNVARFQVSSAVPLSQLFPGVDYNTARKEAEELIKEFIFAINTRDENLIVYLIDNARDFLIPTVQENQDLIKDLFKLSQRTFERILVLPYDDTVKIIHYISQNDAEFYIENLSKDFLDYPNNLFKFGALLIFSESKIHIAFCYTLINHVNLDVETQQQASYLEKVVEILFTDKELEKNIADEILDNIAKILFAILGYYDSLEEEIKYEQRFINKITLILDFQPKFKEELRKRGWQLD